jgi:outer membrane protein assembly factor BamB
VSSGVLVDAGVAYFAAGINNFDGTHVYALDAATGKIKWHNGASRHLDEFSKSGVAAQGDLLLHEGKLYLAGGNASSPGIYDIADGTCLSKQPKGIQALAIRGRELQLDGDAVRISGPPFYSTLPVFDKPVRWQTETVVAKNAQLSFTQEGDAWKLTAQDRAGKATLWSVALPSEPVRWGIAVDTRGRVFVTTRAGETLCFGE